jgi:hypothetical protein
MEIREEVAHKLFKHDWEYDNWDLTPDSIKRPYFEGADSILSLIESPDSPYVLKSVAKQYEDRIKKLEECLKESPTQEDMDAAQFTINRVRTDERHQVYKEIGEAMMLHVRLESGLPTRWVADMMAKLKSGKSPKDTE